ncbi:MAG: 6,7-dimethyl-8-ribityllumazine synthase, partial [Deltaproteobacteria bacterium]|nr:6,7-dimethyl-8-ribityllumazine synthase [Deltaproteobacteria bacterium]
MPHIIEGNLEAAGFKFALVVSRFNSFICDRLLEGAVDTLLRHGAVAKNLTIVKVPGAFEIPLAAQ